MNKFHVVLIIIFILSSCSTTHTQKSGTEKFNELDNATLVYIPGGEFLMGASEEEQDANWHEKPQQTLYLDAFWIYKHEVSNKQFAAFVTESGYQTTAEEVGWSIVVGEGAIKNITGAYWASPKGPDSNAELMDDYPVVQVSYFDAAAYCKWMKCRLPTEAEWEKAARGSDGRTFPWGEEQPSCSLANYNGCVGGASPINSNPEGASPYGVVNMAGNVYEWVADYFKDDYYSVREIKINPSGPADGEFRIIRGGSWNNSERYLRTSSRHAKAPELMFNSLGFRCVCDP